MPRFWLIVLLFYVLMIRSFHVSGILCLDILSLIHSIQYSIAQMVFDVGFTAPNDKPLVRSLLDISSKYHYSYMSVSVVMILISILVRVRVEEIDSTK